jgi:ABC-type arginine transport system permease subunit
MNALDSTTVGIALGLLGATAYTVVRSWRHKSFDLAATVTVFLAAFALPTATVLIRAAFLGRQQALPSNWREHVAIAGIVAIGLGLHYLITTFRAAFSTVPKPGPTPSTTELQSKIEDEPM